MEIRILTPAVMGGADNRLDSSMIRTSEIKAAMRQVFRMFAGKFIDHSYGSIKVLLEKEGKIFGDTSLKSSFKLLVDMPNNLDAKDVKLLPHKNNFSKKAISPNQKFRLKLIILRNIDNISIDFYNSLLKLALLFGVGNRRNRLMGSMKIENENYEDIKNDMDLIANTCKMLFNIDEIVLKDKEPLFSSLTKKDDKDKYYLITRIPMKRGYINNDQELDLKHFEQMLKDLYEKVIHPIEKIPSYKDILGSAKPRQGSFVNFSIAESNNNYYMYVSCFYYKNNNKLKYDYWKKAKDEIKRLAEETFKLS